jgi:hypothetical protein
MFKTVKLSVPYKRVGTDTVNHDLVVTPDCPSAYNVNRKDDVMA